MRSPKLMLTAAVVLSLAASLPAPAMAKETLEYGWTLKGALGRIAGLFLPSQGRGELRIRPASGGAVVTELEITSPQSAEGDFFLYGSEIGPDGDAREAWSAYRWRDEDKSKRSRVDEPEVFDIASGIQLVRRELPRHATLQIWSDGKVYPVNVWSMGEETIRVPAGRFETVHYRIRGRNRRGDRPWKGGLDLWLARDEAATPIQIEVSRGWANVHLELLDVERPGRSGVGASR